MKKILFIDRDGTLICEPADEQVDSLEKIKYCRGVFSALLALKDFGYRFVMVTNQDGLGLPQFPEDSFTIPHNSMIALFESQGIEFDEVLICPHLPKDNCECRKPRLGLVAKYLSDRSVDLSKSYVIGDRESDIILAKNMGIEGIQLDDTGKLKDSFTWPRIVDYLTKSDRVAQVRRKTYETDLTVQVNLDSSGQSSFSTGIGFFDHMLEQIAKHGDISLNIECSGDLGVDEHHTVEDVAIGLGDCLRIALGDKRGIERYGFLLPMDESEAKVSLDLGGRHHFELKADFKRETVGELPTELVGHFFLSLSQALKANLHMTVEGENDHHKIEALFKCFARCFRVAKSTNAANQDLPSTKGVL